MITMKTKFESLKKLEAEKKKLKKRQAELEELIHYNWLAMKSGLSLQGLLKEMILKPGAEKKENSNQSSAQDELPRISADLLKYVLTKIIERWRKKK